MHQNLFVRQVGLQHTGARVRDLHRKRLVIHLKDRDVLELVSLLSTDVNPSAGKLINHLVAAEKRHRISCGEIEDSAPQALLGSRRDLYIEPETNRSCEQRDACQWETDSRHAHAIRA